MCKLLVTAFYCSTVSSAYCQVTAPVAGFTEAEWKAFTPAQQERIRDENLTPEDITRIQKQDIEGIKRTEVLSSENNGRFICLNGKVRGITLELAQEGGFPASSGSDCIANLHVAADAELGRPHIKHPEDKDLLSLYKDDLDRRGVEPTDQNAETILALGQYVLIDQTTGEPSAVSTGKSPVTIPLDPNYFSPPANFSKATHETPDTYRFDTAVAVEHGFTTQALYIVRNPDFLNDPAYIEIQNYSEVDRAAVRAIVNACVELSEEFTIGDCVLAGSQEAALYLSPEKF